MEYDPLARVAFCPLLFAANGGRFGTLGLPIFNPREYVPDESLEMGLGGDEFGSTPRGRCDEPWDCGVCPYMRQWIEGKQHEGWEIGWECTRCLRDSARLERRNPNVERQLAGFYQSGRQPRSPNDPYYDRDRPPLAGCTACGEESSFLQLVLRRARRH